MRGDLLGALFYYSNWWYAFQHVSYFALFAPLTPLGHLWSLAVEEQFYLVWPLLLIVALRFIPRRDVMISLLLVAAAASAIAMVAMYQQGSDPTRVYEGTDTRAFQLLIGAALAFALPSRQLTEAMSRLPRCGFEALGVLGLAGIVVLVVLTNQYDPFLYRGGMVLLSIASLAVVASLAHPGTLVGRALGVRPLRWIGVRSYGIYLWSYPIIVLTTPLDATGPAELVRMVLQVAATLVIAALSWRFIEQPIRTRGFTSVLSRLRAPRIRVIGVPAGLVAGSCAAGVVLAASGVGLTGVIPSAVTASALSALPSSLVMAPSDRTPPATPAPGLGPCGSSSPAASPPPTSLATPTPSLPPPSPDSVPTTVIGDSIMIDLAPYLHPLLPGAFIDGQVSRQMSELPALLGQLKSQGLLYSRVVVELGTNGPGWDPGQIADALSSYGFSTVVLVNAGNDPAHPDWAPLINQELARVAAQVPAATIVNWSNASLGHPSYFMWGSEMGDGIHPGPQGAQVLATMIAQAVNSGTRRRPPPRCIRSHRHVHGCSAARASTRPS